MAALRGGAPLPTRRAARVKTNRAFFGKVGMVGVARPRALLYTAPFPLGPQDTRRSHEADLGLRGRCAFGGRPAHRPSRWPGGLLGRGPAAVPRRAAGPRVF